MSFYKFINSEDRVVSTTNLTEQVTHVSGTGTQVSASKKDYYLEFYTGSAGTRAFDVTFGRTANMVSGSVASGSTAYTAMSRSAAIYNQFAKVLIGADEFGAIQKFSRDSNDDPTDNILNNAYFVNFNRGYFKDKIKPGTFSMEVAVSGAATAPDRKITLVDVSGSITTATRRTALTGEYGILYASQSLGATSIDPDLTTSTNVIQGLVFYEAGVAVVSPYIFAKYESSIDNPVTSSAYVSGSKVGVLSAAATNYFLPSGAGNVANVLTSSNSMGDISQGLANRILTASYQAVTELNSTVYFCRAFNSEFNYSSNPTYLSGSEIRVKSGDPMAQPVSYITSVGLYDDKNQLLAVAKLSEPIKKTPDTELIARVRLDF